MRKLIVGGLTFLLLVMAPAAWSHPSENRADQSTFDGPHCHINVKSGKNAFPSHRAHQATGLPDTIFAGLTECP